MVQEVERREAQLQALAFAEFEILEKREITVEVRRALNVKPNDTAITSNAWRGETARIEVLAGPQITAWVAGRSRY